MKNIKVDKDGKIIGLVHGPDTTLEEIAEVWRILTYDGRSMFIDRLISFLDDLNKIKADQ